MFAERPAKSRAFRLRKERPQLLEGHAGAVIPIRQQVGGAADWRPHQTRQRPVVPRVRRFNWPTYRYREVSVQVQYRLVQIGMHIMDWRLHR